MRSVFWSTNSSVDFLLRRTVPVPPPTTFNLLQTTRRRQHIHLNPPIDDWALLQATASGPPTDSIMKNDGSNEIERSEEKEESSSSDPPPQPPEKPEPGDCCGNGCMPCVWDLYYEELEEYTKNLEAYYDRVSSKKK